MASPWDPEQYRRFAAERAEPFHDLLAMVNEGSTRRIVDLGCGPGELTAHAAEVLGATDALGIDDDPAMLKAAAAHSNAVVRFAHGDIATWTSDHDVDVIIAAASLQWVPDHAVVLERWAGGLATGGQLIVQVPANAHAATHTVAAAVAAREPYRSAFDGAAPPPDPVATNVLTPDAYARVLYDLGFTRQRVVLRVYPHVLPSTHHAVEWVKGTTLTRFSRRLPPDVFARFLREYEAELTAVLGDRQPLFFPFSRILFWAQRS